MSFFCCWKPLAYFFVFFISPFLCLMAAFLQSMRESSVPFSTLFSNHLLRPGDWFSFWQLNCRLASFQALVGGDSTGFEMEDKWTFLREGREREVPITPFMEVDKLVVKHTNEEGGLGLHFFENAVSGGDWIIQEYLTNNHFISSLLPPSSPLSTLRIVTCSSVGRDDDEIGVLSCVFRAGREGARTDHESIMFDVDVSSGEMRGGTTNHHWYQLSLTTLPSTIYHLIFHPHKLAHDLLSLSHDISSHPDTDQSSSISGLNFDLIFDLIFDFILYHLTILQSYNLIISYHLIILSSSLI